LFCLAKNKDAFVADHLQHHNSSTHWEIQFIRLVHDWELESITTFLDLLYSSLVIGYSEDVVHWRSSGKPKFTVSQYYKALVPCVAVDFPWKAIWKPKAPPRVAFFIWTTSLGKILTIDNLRKRNIVLVSWCCVCKAAGEIGSSATSLLCGLLYSLCLGFIGQCLIEWLI
jgi:hypothetical protein